MQLSTTRCVQIESVLWPLSFDVSLSGTVYSFVAPGVERDGGETSPSVLVEGARSSAPFVSKMDRLAQAIDHLAQA